MNRRNFLKNGSFAGITLLPLAGFSAAVQKSENADRQNSPFALEEITIDELQKAMQSGRQTSQSITQLYLKRIESIDKSGPAINAVIEINPDALKIAAQMDKERKSGKLRGPLHGIPVLIKDNIDTADKMYTTAGALALVGNRAGKDAFVAKQLRDAGAVIIGKTNLSEWANFRSTRSTSAWSSRGGQTKNPYILDRNPSGSSSGSGAAVAANLCAVAVGTETDGSVISPSSVNGIVGIKPTVGLVSRSGIIPISKTQDTAGPMARTVTDAAILLGIMTGVDPEDAVTSESAGKARRDYTSYLDAGGLKDKRIGVEKSFLKGHETIVAVFQQALDVLRKAGATIVEVELVKNTNEAGRAEFDILMYEFKDGVNRYLANANAKVKTLADVIAFNRQNEAKAMPFFKQEILENSEAKGDLQSKEYTEGLAKTIGTRKIIDDLMSQNNLAAICGISTGPAGCIDLVYGDYDTVFSFTSPAAMAGYPNITVPMGTVHGLPLGISFMAGAYQEGEVIKLAYAFEQATKKRVAPKFLNSLTPASGAAAKKA